MNDSATAPAVVDDIEVEQNGQAAAVSAAESRSAPVPDDDDAVDLAPVEEAPDADASEAGKKLQSKRGSLQARIDAITKEKYDTARERDDARHELQALRADLVARSGKTPDLPSTPASDAFFTRPEPSEDEVGSKYDTYGEFVKDHGRWVREEIKAEQADSSQRAHVAQRHEAHATKFVEKIAQAETADPEFWSKVSPRIANLRPSSTLGPGERASAENAIADIIFDSEYATDLMAHFSAHDTDFQRLSTLPPNMLFREMGRLEARFHRPTAAPSGPARVTPPVSQAAPPIKPVGSTASASERDPIADDLDIDEHIKVMNARDRKTARR